MKIFKFFLLFFVWLAYAFEYALNCYGSKSKKYWWMSICGIMNIVVFFGGLRLVFSGNQWGQVIGGIGIFLAATCYVISYVQTANEMWRERHPLLFPKRIGKANCGC